MKHLGLIVNLEKEKACQLAVQIAEWIMEQGLEICSTEKIIEELSLKAQTINRESPPDIILVLGGDGTLLDTARNFGSWGVPLMGVNLGQLGFLTEVESNELFDALKGILEGKYWIEKRMMLEAKVFREGKEIVKCIALNDIVIAKGSFSRLLELETNVDEEYVDTYLADGIIVATPTGSTAYSLSAGGPLVVPGVEVMLLTPICPHTLSARTLVISHEQEVKITIKSRLTPAMLTIDGQHGLELYVDDEIYVGKAAFKAQLLRHKQKSFFAITREKLYQGGRSNE